MISIPTGLICTPKLLLMDLDNSSLSRFIASLKSVIGAVGAVLKIGIWLGDFGGLGRTVLYPAEAQFTAGPWSVHVLQPELGAKVTIGNDVLAPPKLTLSVSSVEEAADLALLAVA